MSKLCFKINGFDKEIKIMKSYSYSSLGAGGIKPIVFETVTKKMLADLFTPVGIYLRLRDRFPGSILLESTDFHASENSYSFICVQPIAGIEVSTTDAFEFKYPGEPVIRKKLAGKKEVIV